MFPKTFSRCSLFRIEFFTITTFLSNIRYIEAVFPGEYGVPKKWYFPFTPSYWGFCESEQFADMIISKYYTLPLHTMLMGFCE
jgi:hypothetical protein